MLPSLDILVAALGYGALLPAAVTVGLLLLATRRGRAPASFSGTLEAIAIAAGLLAGFVGLAASGQLDLQLLQPTESWHWLPLLALLVTGVGAVERVAGVSVLRWILRLFVAALAAWALVRAEGQTQPVSRAWLVGLSVGMLSLWGLLDLLTCRQPGIVVPTLLLAAAAVLGGIIEEAGFLKLAQIAGVLAAVLAGCAGVQWRQPHSPATRAAVPAVAVLLPGLAFSGYLETSYSGVSWAAFLLAAAAPLALGTTGLLRSAERPRGWRIGAQVAVTLVPLLAAVALALAA